MAHKFVPLLLALHLSSARANESPTGAADSVASQRPLPTSSLVHEDDPKHPLGFGWMSRLEAQSQTTHPERELGHWSCASCRPNGNHVVKCEYDNALSV